MHVGKYVFSQLCEFLPKRAFDCLVAKYEGDKYVKSFSCWCCSSASCPTGRVCVT